MKKFRWFLVINSIILFFIILFFLWSAFSFFSFINKKASNSNEIVFVSVKRNESLREIANVLRAKDIISKADWFYYYVRLTGKAKSIKAGVHMFRENYTPKDVLSELMEASPYVVSIVIPPGLDLKEIRKKLISKGLNGADFFRLVHNKLFIRKITGINANSFEGLLYPDTYSFYKGIKSQKIIEIMFEEFKNEWSAISGSHVFDLDDYKKVIIASIIEKEAYYPDQYGLVASVIYNRLKKHMKLQMDSTVLYGLQTFSNKLTQKEIDNTFNKYNTYKYYGLPETPICSVGYNALYAALHPSKTNYLYFVASKNKKLVFSKTLRDHNILIQEFKR